MYLNRALKENKMFCKKIAIKMQIQMQLQKQYWSVKQHRTLAALFDPKSQCRGFEYHHIKLTQFKLKNRL